MLRYSAFKLPTPIRTYTLSRIPLRNVKTARTSQYLRRGLSLKRKIEASSSRLLSGPDMIDSSPEDSEILDKVGRHALGNPEEGLRKLMTNQVLVLHRQIELQTIFWGLEQPISYIITNEEGERLGYIAEVPGGSSSWWLRQLFRRYRDYHLVVMDPLGSPVLWLRRPYTFLSSCMFVRRLKNVQEEAKAREPVLDTFARIHGRWHFWRKPHDLFLRVNEDVQDILTCMSSAVSIPKPGPNLLLFVRLTSIDASDLHHEVLPVRDEWQRIIAEVQRHSASWARMLFTDTGKYSIRFMPRHTDSEGQDVAPGLALHTMPKIDPSVEERAAMLAFAVSADLDHYSKTARRGPRRVLSPFPQPVLIAKLLGPQSAIPHG